MSPSRPAAPQLIATCPAAAAASLETVAERPEVEASFAARRVSAILSSGNILDSRQLAVKPNFVLEEQVLRKQVLLRGLRVKVRAVRAAELSQVGILGLLCPRGRRGAGNRGFCAPSWQSMQTP